MEIDKRCSLIEEAFSSYLMNKNEEKFSRDTSTVLHSFDTRKNYDICIMHSNSSTKEPFFGMRIFPSFSFIESVINDISSDRISSISELCLRWKNIPKWIIEIDDRVFDRYSINFNPRELVAMLFHEIGHTIYSDKKIEMFYRAFKESYIRLKTTERASVKILSILYMIPLSMACGIRSWGLTDRDLREEIFADQSVKKMGYGKDLISCYQKIIKAYGSGGYNNSSSSEKELEASINLCNLNVVDLIHRKNQLKDELYHTGIVHNSNYIRDILNKIMLKLGIAKKDKYDGNVVLEQSFDYDSKDFVFESDLVFDFKTFSKLENQLIAAKNIAESRIATEAFGKKKPVPVPSQLDVDTIFVEVDRIQNHADRRYVLDLIYNQEEKIQHFLELCDYDNNLKEKHYGKMQSMLRELDDLRKAVLAKRSFNKEYKLFVKYPEGYEG